MKMRVGQYLIDALYNAGVEEIFGVPGDFNLTFLDDVIDHEHVSWIGNTNELNASYAADGYARINGLGALITTFGVGELSAINGIAGAFAERVPVIAITGAPTTSVEQARKFVHHSLGEGNFDDYRKMFEPITTAQGYITSENATSEIPRLIQAAVNNKRPVHIHLPIDVAATEIDIKESFQLLPMENAVDNELVAAIERQLQNAKQPVIITGHEINSFGLQSEMEDFVKTTGIPVVQLSLGKGAFNEESDYYLGIYDGSVAKDNIRDYVDQSDAILNIGAKITDSASAGFSYQFDIDDVIMLNHHNIKINTEQRTDLTLPAIITSLQKVKYRHNPTVSKRRDTNIQVDTTNKEPLTQATYFAMMQTFLQPNDVVIAEQGTSFFGAFDLWLHANNKFIGQPLWGSIGYTLPATLGSQIADTKRRNILLIGDGSLQLTVQALSTMIRYHLKPIIFVINNDGYTVERMIHGENALYNDIHMWDYKALPQVFGGTDVALHEVNTPQELQRTFDVITANSNQMHFVEVKMHRDDAPEKLHSISKVFAQQNK